MIVIQIDRHGGPEVLEPTEIPEPEATPGRVLVEVAASGVNFIDTYQRTGLYEIDLPFVPGMEGSGTVLEVGPGVEEIEVGDTVAWADVAGSYAPRLSLPWERVVQVPEFVSTDEAAAVMLQGLTAHYLAKSTFNLRPGHRCLIHAGAGGVGRLLIQIAHKAGAEVFTTVGSEGKADLAAAAGADHVISYREVSFVDAVNAIAGERALDVVYDGVGATTFEGGLALLKPRGMMVSFGNASGPVPPVSPLTLAQNGSLFLTRPTLGHHITHRAELQLRASELFDWIANRTLKVNVGATYPLAEAAEAHRALEGRQTVGKVLLRP